MDSLDSRILQSKTPGRDEWRSCFFATAQKSFNTSKNETKKSTFHIYKFS